MQKNWYRASANAHIWQFVAKINSHDVGNGKGDLEDALEEVIVYLQASKNSYACADDTAQSHELDDVEQAATFFGYVSHCASVHFITGQFTCMAPPATFKGIMFDTGAARAAAII